MEAGRHADVFRQAGGQACGCTRHVCSTAAGLQLAGAAVRCGTIADMLTCTADACKGHACHPPAQHPANKHTMVKCIVARSHMHAVSNA